MSKVESGHTARVVKIRRGHDTTAWVAQCTCGWVDRPRPTEEEAEDEVIGHVAAVVHDGQVANVVVHDEES